MTSQTPSSLGTNVIKGQQDASSRINEVVITPDMTPDEYMDMLMKSFGLDEMLEEISKEKAADKPGEMGAVSKLQRKLRALERFPDQMPRQSATPEQQKAGQYLAEQREACKKMLKMEMKDCKKEEGW